MSTKFLIMFAALVFSACMSKSAQNLHERGDSEFTKLTGTITYGGVPYSGANVFVVEENGIDLPTIDEVRSDSEGNFSLSILASGVYSIYVEAPEGDGYLVGHTRAIEVSASRHIEAIELEYRSVPSASESADSGSGNYATREGALSLGCHCHDSSGFWQQICCGAYSKEYGKSFLWCVRGPLICLGKDF